MAQNLSEKKIKLFESIVKFFNLAIKSSASYLSTHPSVENSIKAFKEIPPEEERLEIKEWELKMSI